MRSIRLALVALFAIAGLTLTAAPANAAISSRTLYDTWTSTLAASAGSCDGADSAALYRGRGVLLATFTDEVIGRDAIEGYFDSLNCYENLRVTTQSFASGGVRGTRWASGLYTFHYTDAKGKAVKAPARFTFVWEKNNRGRWLISTHHSSLRPQN
jgi:hypothetical protein